MTKLTLTLAAALLLSAAPAFAADLEAPPPATPAPAPAAAPTTTIGLEVSPELFADPNSATFGNLNDVYGKGTITEVVAPNFTISGIAQLTNKVTTATWQTQLELNAAYKFKLNDNFSVTVTGGLGYTFGNTGYALGLPSGLGTEPFFYYYGNAQLDDKIDSNWTWNIINVRLRDSFTVAWFTPKIQTGVTYNFDSQNAVYANVGYAWKDNGSGLKPDKMNFAVGYKYSF